MKKSNYIRKRGRIYAVVRKPESVAHLAPNSLIHSVHREFARQLHSSSAGLISTDISSVGELKFPSLAGGLTFDANAQITPELAFIEVLNRVRRERKSYRVPEATRTGGTYFRRRRIDPVRQLGVTVFPSHGLALSALELSGVATRALIENMVKEVRTVCVSALPYDLLGFSVHSEESMLHLHVCYSVVDRSARLLHEGAQRGQPARNFLGLGACATLRLVEFGLWPEEDAEDVRKKLRRKSEIFGATPVDWVLSEFVDAHLERFFRLSTDQRVKQAYEIACSEYTKHAKAVRAARPDVLLSRNAQLEVENAALREQISRLAADLPSTAFDAIEELHAVTRAYALWLQQGRAPNVRERTLSVDSAGHFVLGAAFRARVDELIADVRFCKDAERLRSALQEAEDTIRAGHAVIRERDRMNRENREK